MHGNQGLKIGVTPMRRFSHDGRAKKDDALTGQGHNGRAKKKESPQKDAAASYDEFKEFEGRRYTGMKVGRSHKWYYDQGEWKEKKVTPDKWQFTYAVT